MDPQKPTTQKPQLLSEHPPLTKLNGDATAQHTLQSAVGQALKLSYVTHALLLVPYPGGEQGQVITAQHHGIDSINLSSSAYTEMQQMLHTHGPIVLSKKLMDTLQTLVPASFFGDGNPSHPSLLFPMMDGDEVMGALLLRVDRRFKQIPDDIVAIGTTLAAMTATSLASAMEHDLLLRAHQDLLQRNQNATKALSRVQDFVEFFRCSNDGIIVTDQSQIMRYANQAAGHILNRNVDDLVGHGFITLLPKQYHTIAQRALEGQRVGDARGYVDLLVQGAQADDIILSAGIQPIDDGRCLVSFRDVTSLRAIESELQQTKEFLENLIQSSVDAIVAADMDGTIILFNRAAERLLGYSAKEAVGHLRFADLFLPQEAEDILRRIQSEGYGGRGRLELLRKDLISQSLALMPVNLTASAIYESGREIATMSIFTDLRERMRIEEKLTQAQRRLQLSERQSVAMELAGAAAHELNQPLTSIMGYGEILKRRIDPQDVNRKGIEIICRESERMADLVRRIGQITAYKSKKYVGDARILELSTPKKDP